MNEEVSDTIDWQKREINALKATQQSAASSLFLSRFRDRKSYRNSSSSQTVIIIEYSWIKFKANGVSPLAILGCNIVSSSAPETSSNPFIEERATDEPNTVLWRIGYGFDCTLDFEIISTVEGEVTYGDY